MHRSLVRPRRARPQGSRPRALVSEAWQRWVADNLLRGVEAQVLVEGLQQADVPGQLARRTVAAIAASPGLAVARRRDREAQQLEQLGRLWREVGRARTLERRAAPGADELFGRYWAGSLPAVFTDIVPGWRAQWTPQLLRERYGEVMIEACVGRTGDPRPDANWEQHRTTMTLAQYVDRVLAAGETNDLYLIANNRNTRRPELATLWDDVVLPPGWFRTAQLPRGSALWLGPAGTVTPLHHDTSNILFCQVYGRKRVVLAAPWEPSLLASAHGVYNRRGVDVVDDAEIDAIDVELGPGDALFIPAGWWHYVQALDVSVSLAVNAFDRPNGYEWYKPGAVPRVR